MTEDEMSKLKRGDVVRHKVRGDTFVIVRQTGFAYPQFVAVSTTTVSQPEEWDLVPREEV